MKTSFNWLKEWIKADLSPQDLSSRLHMLGFEVASIDTQGPGFSGVVVAEILDIQKHPNADRLSLCEVNDGTAKLRIVCGAKNIAVGQRVPLARIGATLPGGKTITPTKIRGEESQGMLCSAAELGIPETNGGGIHLLPAQTPLGADASTLLGGGDTVLDIEVTPNRPDCLSHFGIARELSISFGVPLPAPQPGEGILGVLRSPVTVAIEDKTACGRYVGRYFQGVKVGPSPSWLARRLETLGLRPINSVVDVTNYVLHEHGHPLHAFDADLIEGGKLFVRWARAGEKLEALDGKTYPLGETDLVIADAKKPVAIAGVMGGAATGVTEKTKNVFLEAAYFAPGKVHRTSRRLGLRSDSSFRFERGTAPASAAYASARAAELIRQLAGGAESPASDNYPAPPDPVVIRVTPERINAILGTDHPHQSVESVLRALAASVTVTTDCIRVMPPPFRLDLTTEWDLAEEVARHLGYASIKDEPAPVRLQRPKTLPAAELTADLRRRAVALGFLEAYNYDFLSDAELERAGLSVDRVASVMNPISEDWAHLRPSLIPGLLRSCAHNLRRGAKGLKLFEQGKAYSRIDGRVHERQHLCAVVAGTFPAHPDWTRRVEAQDENRNFFDAKASAADLLQTWSPEWTPPATAPALLHPKASLEASIAQGPVAWVGLLHPAVERAWDLPAGAAAFVIDLEALVAAPRPASKSAPVSPFPTIVRDLSISVPEDVAFSSIETAARGLPALTRFDLTDRVSGAAARKIGIDDGKVSLTLRLTFGLPDRTLRDEEVNQAMGDLIAKLSKECGARLRA